LTLSLIFILLTLSAACARNTVPSETKQIDKGQYNPPITLTVPGRLWTGDSEKYDYFNNPWIDAYAEELGIVIEPKWEAGGIDSPTLSEQLAAGVVPDLMPGLGRLEFEFAVRLGLAADLTTLIDQHASPLTRQILESDGGYSIQSSTIDDKIYALPHVYGNTDNIQLMWIRTDWLRKLDLEVPKTAEDLEVVLNAFVHQDPDGNGRDDTLGLLSTRSLWEFGPIFNMFGAQPFWSWYFGIDGKLHYSTVSFVPEMKNALIYLQRLYQEGLVYPEFGALPVDRYYKMFADDQAGIAFEYKYLPFHILDNTTDHRVTAEWQAFTIPTGLPDGHPARPFSYHGPAAYNVISSQCATPEAAIRMLNLYVDKVFSKDKDLYYDTYVKSPDGVPVEELAVLRTSVANDLSENINVARALAEKSPSGLSRSETEKYKLCLRYLDGDLSQWAEYQYYRPDNATVTAIKYYTTEVTPFFSDYYGPEPASARLSFDILNNRWHETCTRIIMGADDVGIYDSFVREWYESGGQQAEDDINAMLAGG